MNIGLACAKLHRCGMVVLLLMLLIGSAARAQYYDEPTAPPEARRCLFVGVGSADFAPRESNTAADSARIAFSSVMPLVGFRQGSFELMIGYTRYELAGAMRTGITMQTTVGFDILLSGGPSSALLVPILIGADYTKAESAGPSRADFNLGSVGAGAGLAYRRTGGAVEFDLEAGQLVQYSFEGFGTVYGFSAATLARVHLVLPRVPLLKGIALGYRFRYQSWSMSDKTLNNRLLLHGLSVGILL